MTVLDLPDNIYSWIVNYFKQHGHLTKIHETISAIAFINASIIQGSVTGPPSYVVAASDLHAKSPRNPMMKYADDSYLLEGSSNICSVYEECAHIRVQPGASNPLCLKKALSLCLKHATILQWKVCKIFLNNFN